ncbi:MAG: 4'-phosphopantetheinyl transferase superfamily protein [Dysgonamonadaceae bacterium]|jgi:4'-phosphopantetheinyl transferase EntD|nr:4'-phosphopantetheinyl transferase superfamily protein [Dysgonamonadaceae bacterium]
MKNKIIYEDNESTIGIAPICEDSESLLAQLDKGWYLPSLEKMTESRRQEWLTVRVLLKEILDDERKIHYHPSGKPYLENLTYRISISHTKHRGVAGQGKTKGYVALILNKNREVAIDIERISRRAENVLPRFVNEEEEKALSTRNRLIHILLHWSAKESVFKWVDINGFDFKSQMHISPFEPLIGEWSRFTAKETRTEQQHIFTVHYFVAEDYVLTYI